MIEYGDWRVVVSIVELGDWRVRRLLEHIDSGLGLEGDVLSRR